MEHEDGLGWQNIGLSFAVQPFDWQIGLIEGPASVQICIGPLTIGVGWYES